MESHLSPTIAPIAYRVSDVARMLRLSRSSAYRLVRKPGGLRAIKIGGSVRVLERDFLAYLEGRDEAAA